MNTTITTIHANVACHVATLLVTHAVDHTVRHTGGRIVIHASVMNPFLLTKIQDSLLNSWPRHAFAMASEVAA